MPFLKREVSLVGDKIRFLIDFWVVIVLNYNFLFFYDDFYGIKLVLLNFEAISLQPSAISFLEKFPRADS